MKGAKKWFPSVVDDNPSWPIRQNEMKNYRLGLREVVVDDNGKGERRVEFKSDNVDGVDVRKSNKRVDLSAVKAHLFKVDY